MCPNPASWQRRRATPAELNARHAMPHSAAPHLLPDLLQQRAADQAGPHQADAKGGGGEVEARVHGPQRAVAVPLVHQHRDVVLGGALRISGSGIFLWLGSGSGSDIGLVLILLYSEEPCAAEGWGVGYG